LFFVFPPFFFSKVKKPFSPLTKKDVTAYLFTCFYVHLFFPSTKKGREEEKKRSSPLLSPALITNYEEDDLREVNISVGFSPMALL
jgi:hypothetical protein